MRSGKPRNEGLTVMLDKGMTISDIEQLLYIAGEHIDYAKLGWCTALVTNHLKEKVSVYKNAGIPVFFGGTLFEYYYYRKELAAYDELIQQYGFCNVEISDGTVPMSYEDKISLISRYSKDFQVFSEVGSKYVENYITPRDWVRFISTDLEHGASYVITESREMGKGGICRADGELRFGLIDEIAS